jgi:putative N6-adenine-specific DNA methylase
MKTCEIVVPCHFGLEAITKKEIIDLGYDITEVTDGRVSFTGDADAIARANVFLRTTERVLLKVGSFHAETFEELFQATKALPWEEYIPKDGSFWVTKASSIKSKLFSTRDIQSVMKKAMVVRLGEYYGVSSFEEHGAKYPIRVFALKDEFMVCLDTSGESLHKRGYRLKQGLAPITETLAAALIMLAGWRDDRPFVDPMCGSGTFPIEAAMMAAHIAPGMDRAFTSEAWTNLIDRKLWYNAVEEANDLVDRHLLETGYNAFDKKVDIQGYDIDPEVIQVARENAERAGVDKLVHLQVRDVADMSHGGKHGYIITNPPYGERIEDKRNLPMLYTELREVYQNLDPSWSMHIITAWEDAVKYLGRADRNRKIYNGMMKTYFYSYDGWKRARRMDDAKTSALRPAGKERSGRMQRK